MGVDRPVAVQVRVQRKVRQGLPRWLIGGHFQAVHVQRRIMPYRGAGNHWDSLHAITEFTTFLCGMGGHDTDNRLVEFRRWASLPTIMNVVVHYLLLLHLQLHLDRLLLVFTPLVLEPDPDDPWREARHLDQLFLHQGIRPGIGIVAGSEMKPKETKMLRSC